MASGMKEISQEATSAFILCAHEAIDKSFASGEARIVASAGQLDKLEALGWLLCDALGCVKARDCWVPLVPGSSFCWGPELQGSTSPSSSWSSTQRRAGRDIRCAERAAQPPLRAPQPPRPPHARAPHLPAALHRPRLACTPRLHLTP